MARSKVESPRDTGTLVRAAQAGDKQALGELVATHLPLVYNVIGRALNGHADVDDLVQESMVRVMRGLPGLREPDRFRSWAVTIAHRQIQRYLREHRSSRLRLQEAPPELADPSGDFAERTVTELVLTGQRRELVEATRWLADDDRHLLALWWQEAAGELTRSELAEALAITPQHAAVRLQRMRARLDSARSLVRALWAEPRCPDLPGLGSAGTGPSDSRSRKRLTRHVRECPRCTPHRHGLVPPERLLLGVSALPLPVAVAEGVRIALDAIAPAMLAPAVGTAVQSAWQSVVGTVHRFLQVKTAAAATAAAVLAGGGFSYAVYETRLPEVGAGGAAAYPSVVTSGETTAVATPTGNPAVRQPSRPAGPGVVTGLTRADLYVAPDGSDGADGSLERPYATLNKAVAVVRPGQTIALRGGTYRPTEPVVIDASGTPDRRITLGNYRDERPVIDASAVPADKWMVTHRGSYWTVLGLEVMNSRSHAYVCVACRHNVFRRLSMHDNVRSGLTLREPGTVGNQVLDSDFFGNYDPADRGRSGVGLAVKFGSGEGNLVRGCRAFDNAATGFDVGHFAGSVRLEHNWSYGNGVNRWGAAEWQSNADGFRLGGGNPAPAAPHVLRQNAAWDNAGHGFADGGNPGAVRLERNTSFRNGGTGFEVPAAAAVLERNAAAGNASPASLGDDGRSSGNSWDRGGPAGLGFRSTDPASAQGQRRPDGRLPPTEFLVGATDLGATMRPPAQ
ncbi:sigma-70 family RNA polymerase sigma factor [Plantactinospora sp. DSM 117369]